MDSLELDREEEKSVIRARKLKLLRKITGLNIIEFSEKIGISRATVSYWENSARGGLSSKGAKNVVNYLKTIGIECSYDWLFNNRGNPPKFPDKIVIQQDIFSIYKSQNKNQEMLEVLTSINEEISLFLERNQNAVITKIKDVDFEPFFRFGDIVGGIWQPIISINTLPCICIIHYNDNNEIVHIIKRLENDKFLCKLSNHINSEEIFLKEAAQISRLWRN